MNPYSINEYQSLNEFGNWNGGWVRNNNQELEYISRDHRKYLDSVYGKTEVSPYPEDIAHEMLNLGFWDEGYVRIGDKTIYWDNAGNTITPDIEDGCGCGCDSGCGCGSDSGCGSETFMISPGSASISVVHEDGYYMSNIILSWSAGIAKGFGSGGGTDDANSDGFVSEISWMEGNNTGLGWQISNKSDNCLSWEKEYEIGGTVTYTIKKGSISKVISIRIKYVIPEIYKEEYNTEGCE